MVMKTEIRSVENFSEVALQFFGDIRLEQGERDSLAIEADEDLLSRLKSEIQGRRLVIGLRSWLDWVIPPSVRPVHYRISMREIHALSISGAGTLFAPAIRTDQLRLEISGSGEVNIQHLECETLSILVTGAGKMELAGRAARQEIQISGAGTYHAGDLESDEASVRISGSGEVSINPGKILKVSISGSGQVSYKGQPAITQSITGAGKVEPVKD